MIVRYLDPSGRKWLHLLHMGGCQNYGPFLGTLNIRVPYYIKDPKRDHNFDNHPHTHSDSYAEPAHL